MRYGYARVSTNDQDLTIQIKALEANGCSVVYREQLSGTTRDPRTELARALAALAPGDVLVAMRLDRIARSTLDLLTILREIHDKGAAFACLAQNLETITSTGRLLVHVLAAIAEFESDIRADRQRDGIERAKALGKYKKPTCANPATVVALLNTGLSAIHVANKLNISRASVYRLKCGKMSH